MKKLLLFSALFFTMGSTFATTQDDVAAVLAKTKYKNIMTFLGAVSIHPDYCANGIVYESVCPIEIRYHDNYVLGRNWLSDTVALCCEYVGVSMSPYYYDINQSSGYHDAEDNWHSYSDYAMDTTYDSYGSYDISYSCQNFVYYADSLYYFGDDNDYIRLTFPADTDCELFFIQLSYFNDKKVHIRYRRNVVRNTNTTQEIKCKYELIDNDRSGRAAFTFLTELSDSVVYQIVNKDWNWSSEYYQKFTKYLYFDTVPYYLYIKNYYNGCLSAYDYWYDYPQPMPRIHDTIVEYVHDTTISFVHDTIYIFRTDTIYLQTAINAKSVNNLNIFPNPTTQFVTVDAESEFSYTLTNTAGKVLRKDENQASYLIDMSEYPSGTYMLTTSDGATHKIVKK